MVWGQDRGVLVWCFQQQNKKIKHWINKSGIICEKKCTRQIFKRYSQQYGTTVRYKNKKGPWKAFQISIFKTLLLILPFFRATEHRAHLWFSMHTKGEEILPLLSGITWWKQNKEKVVLRHVFDNHSDCPCATFQWQNSSL